MAEAPESEDQEDQLENWLPAAFHTTIVNPTPETHVSILDDRAILLNLDTGAYHALNSVATVIWENFTSDCTLANIQNMLCERYEVEAETARKDLLELVIRLYHMGLVTLDQRS